MPRAATITNVRTNLFERGRNWRCITFLSLYWKIKCVNNASFSIAGVSALVEIKIWELSHLSEQAVRGIATKHSAIERDQRLKPGVHLQPNRGVSRQNAGAWTAGLVAPGVK